MSLFNLFRKKQVAPERVLTDEIIPLHGYDDIGTFRAMSLDFSMQFDDVMDADRLVGALEKLLSRPGWKKLGARLRLNNANKLEYHVPIQYTKERPAVKYSHTVHDMCLMDHPIASQVPRPGESLVVGPNAAIFEPLVRPPDNPKYLEDWIYSDRPQLQVHIVSFHDATFVTLTWMHTLFDAMGRNALLKAWQAMLEGRENDIPEIYGYDFDPLTRLGQPDWRKSKEELERAAREDEESVLRPKQIIGWRFWAFVFNYVWEMVFYRKEEGRFVCIPPAMMKRLRQSAIDDLVANPAEAAVMDTSDPKNPKPFLSEGDVLSAWWSRTIMACQPWAKSANPNKTIAVQNAFGMRNLLSSTEPKLLPKTMVYMSNCIITISSFFTLHELLSLPLGVVASRIRKDIAAQTTRKQVDATSKLIRQSPRVNGHPALFGSPDMSLSTFSNWTKGKMFETDFSAAVITEGERKHKKGVPSFIQAGAVAKNVSIRNSGPIVGKDAWGNYWLGCTLRKGVWEKVVEALEGM